MKRQITDSISENLSDSDLESMLFIKYLKSGSFQLRIIILDLLNKILSAELYFVFLFERRFITIFHRKSRVNSDLMKQKYCCRCWVHTSDMTSTCFYVDFLQVKRRILSRCPFFPSREEFSF